MRRRATAALVVALTASGCSLPWSGPDPEPVAERAARQLSAGKPGDAFDVAAPKLFGSVTQSLGVRPKVSVTEVSTDGDEAEATLRWSWPVAAKPWTYTSTLPLRRDGEDWQARLTRTAIQPDLAAETTLTRSAVKAQRGRILGAEGAVIVEPRPVLRVGLDKTRLGGADVAASARRVAQLADIDAAAFVKASEAAGAKAFVPAITYRRSEAPSWALGTSVPGLAAISDRLPLAPTKDFAPALLGNVGPATAEIVEKSDGRLRAGDDAGLSGLQARYDERLGGASGVRISAVAGDGEREELYSAAPSPGEDLTLSLDPGLQARANRALADVRGTSALVAIRPSTGDVLASANGGESALDTALLGQNPPGSTFKIVTALALLRAGLTPSSTVACDATTTVDGRRFKNYSDYPADALGRIPLREAIAQSCNTAFIGNRDRIKPGALAQAAAALGFGVDHSVGFPSYFGEVPDAQSETERAAELIGQGRVEASPLAMALVLSSVVASKAVLPRLVEGVEVKQEKVTAPLTPTETRQLREMLRAVVDHGSGVQLRDLGSDVLAKTGTAEFGTGGETHGWMVGSRGDLAVAVFVEKGESGSRSAGPALRSFLAGGA